MTARSKSGAQVAIRHVQLKRLVRGGAVTQREACEGEVIKVSRFAALCNALRQASHRVAGTRCERSCTRSAQQQSMERCRTLRTLHRLPRALPAARRPRCAAGATFGSAVAPVVAIRK